MMKVVVILLASVMGCFAQTTVLPASSVLPSTTELPSVYGSNTWTLVQHPNNFGCVTNAACLVTTAAITPGNLVIVWSSAKYSGTNSAFNGFIYLGSVTDSGGTADTFVPCPNSLVTAFPASGSGTTWRGQNCYYTLSANGGATSVSATWTFQGLTSPTYAIDVEVLEYHPSITPIYYDTGNAIFRATCTTCAAPPLLLNATSDLISQAATGSGNHFTAITGSYTNPADFDTAANVGSGFAGALTQSSGLAAPNWTQSTTGTPWLSAVAFGTNPSPLPTYDGLVTFVSGAGPVVTIGTVPTAAILAPSVIGEVGILNTTGAWSTNNRGPSLNFCNSGPQSSLFTPMIINATVQQGASVGTSPLNLCGTTSTTGSNVGFVQGWIGNFGHTVAIGFTLETTCPSTAPLTGECGALGGLIGINGGDFMFVHWGGTVHGAGNIGMETNVGGATGNYAVSPNTAYRINMLYTSGTSPTQYMVVCPDNNWNSVIGVSTGTGVTSSPAAAQIEMGIPGEEPTAAGYQYWWRNVVISSTGTPFSTSACKL
jgi:hypothetical protein